MLELTIREASAADIPVLAPLHVVTWNATYAPMGMKGPPVEVRERQWREKFATTDPAFFCFVAENARGEVVGFAQANRSDNPEFEGELNKIYLLREYQRLGVGRRLIGHVDQTIRRAGVGCWRRGATGRGERSAGRTAISVLFNRLHETR